MYEIVSTLRGKGQEYLLNNVGSSFERTLITKILFRVLIRFVLKYAVTDIFKRFGLRKNTSREISNPNLVTRYFLAVFL